MLTKTDDNHASTDPSYVGRVLRQYDTHVLANVFPDVMGRSDTAHTVFEAFGTERGRAVVDAGALPTTTPIDAVTQRLLK